MNLKFIHEPQLEFGQSIHICPRKGIGDFEAYDVKFNNRRTDIQVGVIGLNENIEKFLKWIETCQNFISPKPKSKQPNLFTSFCGFNANYGFKANLVANKDLSRPITNQDIKRVLEIPEWDKRLSACADLYIDHISYLGIDKSADIIVCIIPTKLQGKIMHQTLQPVEETIETSTKQDKNIETDFRRLLKAKAMSIGKPIQLILQDSLEPYKEKSGRQDDATKAWNFCTALYYKANHTPWRLIRDNSKVTACFVGISFYRSRDRKQVHTSLAQLFDDLGNGVILRGSPVDISDDDRQPHLRSDQASALLAGVIKEYETIHKTNPARVVIHKTSNFNDAEMEGFYAAAKELRISYVDYITILDSSTRVFRNGLYAMPRGTHIEVDDKTHLLFTKGSVEYYQTYPGMYVPRPIEIRIVESDESAKVICDEIMSLTKMNWNNTQIDGKYPITIDCARRVGLIMKYIPENVKAQTKYSFYM